MKYAQYVLAVIMLGIAVGAWGFAIGLYYAHDWGGTPEQVCSRSSC